MLKQYYVYIYILANHKGGTLCIGITNDLCRRMYEHKNKLQKGFTEKYNVDKLVYFETFENIKYAIQREKNLKKWFRLWKIELIEKYNPIWRYLYYDL